MVHFGVRWRQGGLKDDIVTYLLLVYRYHSHIYDSVKVAINFLLTLCECVGQSTFLNTINHVRTYQ